MAYEQFICKGLKVNNKDLQRLTEIFDYYDTKLSDDFPSLTNEVLQDCETLIGDYFKDTKRIDIGNYNIQINLLGWIKDTSYFDVNVYDKTGYQESNYKTTVDDKQINSNYNIDSFNTIYNACKKVYDEVKEQYIESIINAFKL